MTVAEYVYGIIEATAEPPGGSGIGDAPLRVVGGDGAAALVSDIPAEDLRLGRKEMLTHARVLEEALSHGTVLPMRFGIVMEEADVRKRLLDGHRAHLREELERMAGKVEMSVRVVYEEEPLMREVVQEHPEIERLRRSVHGRSEDATYYDRIRLGELVAQAVEHKREAESRQMIELLEPLSVALDVGEPSHERVVLSASFLVARDQLKRFDETLEQIAQERAERMRFKLVGPLPPHSFVDLEAGV